MNINSPKFVGHEGKQEDGRDASDPGFRSTQSVLDLAQPSPALHRTSLDTANKSAFTSPVRSTLASRTLIPMPVVGSSTCSALTTISTVSSSVTFSNAVTRPGPCTIAELGLMASSSNAQIPMVSPHIAPSHSVANVSLSVTNSTTPMASIIKGTPHVQQTLATHLTHPAVQTTYSSHVPRGAAAVACITAHKSAVATPIPRPTHIIQSQSASSVTTLHSSIPPRSSTMVTGRTGLTPPVPKSLVASVQSSDSSSLKPDGISMSPALFRLVNSCAPSNLSPVMMPGVRSSEPIMRPAILHNIPFSGKPQSFTQHLPSSLSEKGFYKSQYPPTTVVSVLPPPACSSQAITMAPTIAAAVAQISQPPGNLHLSSHLPIPSQSLKPSLTSHSHISSQQSLQLPVSCLQSMATLTAAVSTTAPTAHTQITSLAQTPSQPPMQLPKVIAQTIHTVMPPPPHHSSIGGAASVCRTLTTAQSSLPSVQRLMNSSVVTSTATIPVAKVYPQSPPVTSRSITDTTQTLEVPVTGSGLFVTTTHQSSPGLTISTSAPTTTQGSVSVPALPSGVIITEARQERTALAPGSYSLPPTATYFYEPYQVSNTLTVHPYTGSTTSHPFGVMSAAAALRTGLLQTHQSSGLGAPVQAPTSRGSLATNAATPVHINSIISAITPSNSHVSMQATYGSSAEAVTSSSEPLVVATPLSPHPPISNQPHAGCQSAGNSNSSVSPRPSILRKRTSDGIGARKNLLSSLSGSPSPSPHLEVSTTNLSSSTATFPSASALSPKPQSENVRDSSTPSESNDSTSNGNHLPLVIIKKEPLDTVENGCPTGVNISGIAAPVEASPRKKPRKQQLTGIELVETHSTEGEEDFECERPETIKKEIVREDEDGVRWVATRQRPPVTLLNSYRYTWKSRHNHFSRYSDVKLKDEKRPTVNDFANQRGIIQKANGWKIWHLCSQFDEMVELEDMVHSLLSGLLDGMEKRGGKENEDRDINRANELIKGNLQRSKIIRDQMKEARQQVIKVLDHKPNIIDIVGRYVSKRAVKKKERN